MPPLTFTSPATLHEILEELYTLRRFHATAGLHRIQSLLEALGKPHNRFPSIHIAGTNGKGTVSSVLASVLREAGFTVGLYTSPHILRFNERIRVNGEEVSDEDLYSLVQTIMPLVVAENATFFEAATALAFQHFAARNVDIAIIETGLGGRLDATNILTAENVLATAITSIDYDHTEYLGDTLPEIASEKAGIMKQNVPCVIAESRPSLRATFEDYAERHKADILFLDDEYSVLIQQCKPDFSMTVSLTSPQGTLHTVESRLCGTHQAHNILTAFAVLDRIGVNFRTTPDHFRSGLQSITANSGLRGRIELLSASPVVVMDVAHNPAGMTMLIQTLERCGYADVRWNALFAAMQDKQMDAMLATLAPVLRRLHVPTLSFPRARTARDIVHEASRFGIVAEEYPSVADACERVFATNEPTLIVGSFHLAEDVLRWWEAHSAEIISVNSL
ncbi:MAG: bifunctional folylpolyglutamate synthase/dihydrofolate synthase [Ignavibacteria bacterium]|nr:bifunctional folylpolyglutamate synthase/dihydrofolate synthase [Ignavibacteria bacterium]